MCGVGSRGRGHIFMHGHVVGMDAHGTSWSPAVAARHTRRMARGDSASGKGVGGWGRGGGSDPAEGGRHTCVESTVELTRVSGVARRHHHRSREEAAGACERHEHVSRPGGMRRAAPTGDIARAPVGAVRARPGVALRERETKRPAGVRGVADQGRGRVRGHRAAIRVPLSLRATVGIRRLHIRGAERWCVS